MTVDKYSNGIEEQASRGCFDDLEIEVQPTATDRHITPELSKITGADILVSGCKSDGSKFRNRRLNNCSYETTKKGIVVRGFSPDSNGVRSFNLSQLTDLKVAQ